MADTEKIKEIFSNYDVDGDGTISVEELAHVLRKLNSKFEVSDVRTMFASMDANKDGKVELGEFVDWVAASDGKYRGARAAITNFSSKRTDCDDTERRRKYRGWYGKLDKNGDGKLDFQELTVLMKKRYPDMELPDLRFLYDCADRSNDGMVDFFEFVDLILSVPQTKAEAAKTKSQNPQAEGFEQYYKKAEEDQKKWVQTVKQAETRIREVRAEDKRHSAWLEEMKKAKREEYAKTGQLY
eukprot:TRINITY_DN5890_c0_g1_i1.p2 TRINITY_DN5890_c0_g1~~TRINITY_DN5890_c0_g1_i1.p2  ORF type:complete len:241 (+),score=82.56 TRINITY_DN5890_c0_g1_i1:54-776(+)